MKGVSNLSAVISEASPNTHNQTIRRNLHLCASIHFLVVDGYSKFGDFLKFISKKQTLLFLFYQLNKADNSAMITIAKIH